MTATSRYWQMAMLTSAGKQRLKSFTAAQECYQSLFEKNDGLDPSDDRNVQTYLWHQWQADDDTSPIALLCLRCWVSHQIAAACYQLASQFGTNYGFGPADLWPLALDDDGRLKTEYQPFSLKILTTYDPTQAALSTWAVRLTKGNSNINSYLLEQGLYRISSWALLNDTAPSRLQKALPGLSQAELKAYQDLLSTYHQVYRRDRIIQRQQTGRMNRCEEPTPQQLNEMAPAQSPAVVLSQLGELAAQLRAHRVAMRRGMPPTRSFDAILENKQYEAQHYTESKEEDAIAQDDFIQRYRSHFLSGLDDAIESVAKVFAASYQKKKPPKGNLFLSALNLFHCEGLSMSAIARQIGLSSQVQVTRLLKLKRFRAEVCAHWLNQLKQQVEADALKLITPERLTAITQQLSAVLSEETENIMNEAAAEAQISKNRQANSTFARRLCARLPAMGLSKQ